MPGVHLRVVGRVQGVGFRWFVRENARRLGLAGWVRNLPDGSVEIAAAGIEQSVQRLAEVVRVGPDGARVDEVREIPPYSGAQLPHPFSVIK